MLPPTSPGPKSPDFRFLTFDLAQPLFKGFLAKQHSSPDADGREVGHIAHLAVEHIGEMRTRTPYESGCLSQIENSGDRNWIHKPSPINGIPAAACMESLLHAGFRQPTRRANFSGLMAVLRHLDSHFAGICEGWRPCGWTGSYGASNRMSRFTRTVNLYPAGTLIVGCTFRLRRVI